jgi:hypothetical protein
MLIRCIAGLAVLATLILGGAPASAASAVDQATLDFPNSVTFHTEITAPAKITSLVLEYGDQQKTCGQVVAEAFPQITPATTIQADWTWDMRQSGSLPPGAQLWWRWRYTDESGKQTVTETKTITWLDSVHPWQTVSKGDIRLHWYAGNADFAQQLVDAADSGMKRVEAATGLTNDQPIDEYIYVDTFDMQAAVLYEPSWTGGQAYPEYNIVIIGISPHSKLEWGLSTEVHELTHVLVGHYTFTCLGWLPTWLQEGLAMFAEGPLDAQFQTPLGQAVQDDTLIAVRSMSGPFSAESGKAELSYGESFSIVNFLLDEYGNQKMNALLIALRDGNTVDEALTSVYGFNVDGLEEAWRLSIGAQPRLVGSPTAVPTATVVPTIVPVSGALAAVTPTPFTYPTLAPGQARSAPPLSLTLVMLVTCCVLGLVVGVIVLMFFLSLANRKGGKDEKSS